VSSSVFWLLADLSTNDGAASVPSTLNSTEFLFSWVPDYQSAFVIFVSSVVKMNELNPVNPV